MFGVGGGLSLTGCIGATSSPNKQDASDATLTLATTTTTYDSGLIEELLPGFKQQFGVGVDPIIRGTGGALQTARAGDCDLVFVHARPLEDAFLREGYGVNRRSVMVNDFLIVGPSDDPANIAEKQPIEAFKAIAATEVTFLSRGDRSGTHPRERQLWEEANIDPEGSWYTETGQGMGNTLIMAGQTGAYTLTERGTFLNVAEDALIAHVSHGTDDPPALLRNEYAIIPVNPAYHDTAYPLAMAFVGYITGPGQSTIKDFQVDNEQAFRPLGSSQKLNFEQYVPRDWQRLNTQ
jgi:tungstate transport system substrate-binding protein